MDGPLVVGLLLKTVGWPVITFSIGVYGGICMYERMIWMNNAKCKEFKNNIWVMLTTSLSFCAA